MKNILIFCSMVVLLLSAAIGPAAAQTQSIILWPHGAPGPHVRNTPETVRLTEQGEHIISGVRQPSITLYLPAPERATGAAIVVLPGGGHRELWMDHEGHRVGQWLSDHGVAAFVLKYRLSQEPASPYSLDDSVGDVQRAIRLARSRAAEWRIASRSIGVMGFSAGGQLAALAAWRDTPQNQRARDPIDRESSRPAFAALIYPSIPSHDAFSGDTPPTFLMVGGNDRPEISEGTAEMYLALKRAGAATELHVLAGVGHGFGLRDSNSAQVSVWPTLLYNWLDASGFLANSGTAAH